MLLVTTYMYDFGEIAFERAADVYAKQFLWLGLICMTLEKLPLRGLLMYVCTIAFSSWMVVLNQLVSHSLVLLCNFTGLLVNFEENHAIGGREKREIA